MRFLNIGWIILFSLSFQGICAQFLTRTVISAMGLNSLINGIYTSSTVGESISGTLNHNYTYLTQGFQQPLIINKEDPGILNLDAIDVYPNPFIDKISIVIEVKDINNYSVEILSIQGRELYSLKLNNIYSGIYELNLEDLPSGVYLLQIQSPLLKTNKVFRIVKI